MLFKWLKSHLPKFKGFLNSAKLERLKKHLNYDFLWRFDHQTVSRGVAVGLFAAAIPLLPFQTLIGVLMALLIRANLPVVLAVSWVSNPFTIVPITYLTYAIGNWLLGGESAYQTLLKKLHLTDTSLSATILHSGKAFFVGLPIIAIGSAVIGYLLVMLIWYLMYLLKHPKK